MDMDREMDFQNDMVALMRKYNMLLNNLAIESITLELEANCPVHYVASYIGLPSITQKKGVTNWKEFLGDC